MLADRRLPRSKLAGDRRKAPALDDAHEDFDAFEPVHLTLPRGMLRRSGMIRTLFRPGLFQTQGSTCGDAPGCPLSRSGADAGSRIARSRTRVRFGSAAAEAPARHLRSVCRVTPLRADRRLPAKSSRKTNVRFLVSPSLSGPSQSTQLGRSGPEAPCLLSGVDQAATVTEMCAKQP